MNFKNISNNKIINILKLDYKKFFYCISNIYVCLYIISIFRTIKFQNLDKENFEKIVIAISTALLLYWLTFSKVKDFLKQIGIFILTIIIMEFLFFEEVFSLFKYDTSPFNTKNSFLCICLSIISIIRNSRHKTSTKNNIEKLYPSRKLDLDYIENSLNNNNILGLDGQWGIGKTFLIKKLEKRDFKSEYITISLLNIDSEEIIPYILNQINKILKRNGIYSFYLRKVKNVLGSQSTSFFNFSQIFSSNETTQEIVEEYKKIISTFDKRIIIIFDDLDRVKDTNKIDKVLNFGVDFSQDNLKFIYLYNQDQLDKLGNNVPYNREFIEKFIPMTSKISSVNFLQALENTINKKEYNSLPKDDFLFLKNIFNKDLWGDNKPELLQTVMDLGKIFGFHDNLFDISFLTDIITPRKIEIFV